jgi:hypothetical protein
VILSSLFFLFLWEKQSLVFIHLKCFLSNDIICWKFGFVWNWNFSRGQSLKWTIFLRFVEYINLGYSFEFNSYQEDPLLSFLKRQKENKFKEIHTGSETSALQNNKQPSESNSVGFFSLPSELIIQIFMFLSFEDYPSLSRVSDSFVSEFMCVCFILKMYSLLITKLLLFSGL